MIWEKLPDLIVFLNASLDKSLYRRSGNFGSLNVPNASPFKRNKFHFKNAYWSISQWRRRGEKESLRVNEILISMHYQFWKTIQLGNSKVNCRRRIKSRGLDHSLFKLYRREPWVVGKVLRVQSWVWMRSEDGMRMLKNFWKKVLNICWDWLETMGDKKSKEVLVMKRSWGLQSPGM